MASMTPGEPKDVLKCSLRFRDIILNGVGLYFGIFTRTYRLLVQEAKKRNVKITIGDLDGIAMRVNSPAHLEP